MVSRAVRNFGKVQDAVGIPDLVAIQRSSYESFLQKDVAPTKRKRVGLEALLQEIFPIDNYDKTMHLEYLYYELEKPRYTTTECRQLRLTYAYPLKVCCRLRTKEGEDLAEQSVYVGEMPVMIGGGEFVINGAERVIVSQLHRSPGVDFLIDSKEGDRILHGGRIIPERGSWIEISVTRKDVLIVKIDQSSKIPATIFLRAISPEYSTTEEILRLFYATKVIPKARLAPEMWSVKPIVDMETGEIIVKAGAQIGNRVQLVQSASISAEQPGPREKIEPQETVKVILKFEKKQSPFFDIGSKKVLNLLKKNPLALVVGVLCTSPLTADGSYESILKLKDKLGDLSVEDIAGRSIKEMKEHLAGLASPDVAKVLVKLCKLVVKEHEGRMEALWENKTAQEVIDELSAIVQTKAHNFGSLLVNMLHSNIKALSYGREFPDPENIDISLDEDVCRVIARLGLIKERKVRDKILADGKKKALTAKEREIVLETARRLLREYPGRLNMPLLQTGRQWCKLDKPDCGNCPLSKFCSKLCVIAPKTGRSKKGDAEVEVIEQVRDALILNTIAGDDCPDQKQALLKFYMRLRPGNPPNEKKAETFFAEKFFDVNRYRLGKVGRFRLNRKFEQSVDENEMTLRPEDFLNTMRYIVALRNNEGVLDDIDHLGNRRLRTIDELAADEIRKGLLKLRKTVQERMSLRREAEDPIKVADLLNSKSVSSSINYFFGRGELSQIVDQTNALSQLTHERRLSALGPGGLNRRRAGFEVRDVHISHYGRICPIETPEGTNIGLIASLAIFSAVDEYGFLLTPYRKVKDGRVTDEVSYLRADEEMKAILAPPSTVDHKTGKVKVGTVLARKSGELAAVSNKDIDYVDISPKQIVGLSASLIPFLEHDDANRALMGSNMQRQAVPLLKTEVPLVGTGMEEVVGWNSSMVVRAENAGVVTKADATSIVINHTDEYELSKFVGLNERTCLNQKAIVQPGDKVSKNQVIADGGGTSNGVLALGKNVLVGFVSFDGFNFEDAIIVSERLVKDDSFTSIHIDEFTAEVRETRLGREEFTCDIPNVSEKALQNLNEHGVIQEGTRVCPGDILVGKVVPKSKTELTPEEKLLHAIFGRAGEDVKNDSLELPSGYEGVVIKTERFTRRGAGGEEQKKALKAHMKRYESEMKSKECMVFRQMVEAIHKKYEVNIVDPSTRQKVGVSHDDEVVYEQIENFNIKWVRPASSRDDVQKIVDRFWTKIKELQDEKNRRVETLKHGDELASGVLEMVKIYIATKRTLSIGDKMAGRHGNKGVIAKIMPEEDMPFLEDGRSLDILLNPLGVPSRMNVGQILETHLGWVAKVLGFSAVTPVFDGATEDDIQRLTIEANDLMSKRKAELDGKKVISRKVTSIEDAKEFLIETLEFQYVTVSADKISRKGMERVEERLMLEFPCSEKNHVPRFNKKSVKSEDVEDFKKTFEKEASNYEKEIFTKCLKSIRDKRQWFRDPKDAPKDRSGIYFFRDVKTKFVGLGYVGISYDRKDGISGRMESHYTQNDDSLLIGISKERPEFEKIVPQFEKRIPSDDELFVHVPSTLKTQLYDGRTGEAFDQKGTIGYIYMMKLHHLVDDKIHARATGPYSLITQQPLGGKARTGGQRFGEMEVWALEGYGAAYTLQEMLTVKSDDVEGRTKIYESMVKGQNSLEAGTPLSFDVLCNEIRGLGLNIQLEKKRLGSTAL